MVSRGEAETVARMGSRRAGTVWSTTLGKYQELSSTYVRGENAPERALRSHVLPYRGLSGGPGLGQFYTVHA